MKRNLLSILILALLIVNLVLTAIMMFSVTSTTKKSAALVDSIASALALELTDPSASAATAGGVSLADTEMYNFADTMTIQLRPGDDGASHYFVTGISLSINKSSDGYKTYGGEAMANWDQLMQGQISTVIGGYTIDQAQVDQEGMRRDIVSALQTLFESDLVYNVTFVNPIIQ